MTTADDTAALLAPLAWARRPLKALERHARDRGDDFMQTNAKALRLALDPSTNSRLRAVVERHQRGGRLLRDAQTPEPETKVQEA